MEMMNKAIEDSSRFQDLLSKMITVEKPQAATVWSDPEIVAWHAEVDRKRKEKEARKAGAK
jgi:hypothetical protein